MTANMPVAMTLIASIFLSAPISADDHIVDCDIHFDFSRVRTFAIRDGKVSSARAELNNSLVIQNLRQSISTALTARGMKETTGPPDAFVDFSVDGLDYSVGPFGRPPGSKAAASGEDAGGPARRIRRAGTRPASARRYWSSTCSRRSLSC